MTNELTLPERALVAIGYSKHAGYLMDLASESSNIKEITNQGGYQDAQSRRMVLRSTRTEITRLAKVARDDANLFAKAVIAEEAKLLKLIEPEENRLKKLQDAYDAKIAAERLAVAMAEENRISEIRKRIESLRANLPFGATSADIAKRGEVVNLIIVDDTFAEFYGEAVAVKKLALEELSVAWTNTAALEAAAEENAKLREQLKAIQPAVLASENRVILPPVKTFSSGVTKEIELEAHMVTFSEITIKYTDEEISEVLYSERGDEGIPLSDEELAQLINQLSFHLDDRHK